MPAGWAQMDNLEELPGLVVCTDVQVLHASGDAVGETVEQEGMADGGVMVEMAVMEGRDTTASPPASSS